MMKDPTDILYQSAPCPQDFERNNPPFYVAPTRMQPRKPDCVPLRGTAEILRSPRNCRYLIAVWKN